VIPGFRYRSTRFTQRRAVTVENALQLTINQVDRTPRRLLPEQHLRLQTQSRRDEQVGLVLGVNGCVDGSLLLPCMINPGPPIDPPRGDGQHLASGCYCTNWSV